MAPQQDPQQGENFTPPVEHIITVGKVTHRFSPEVITANVGDTLNFEFFPANHSVIRSTWENPCIPYEQMTPASQRDNQGRIYSGFWPVTSVVDDVDMPWFNTTVKTSDPIYIYCAAPGSCNESGMIMVINPPSEEKNITTFRQNALKAPFQLVPGQAFPSGEGTGAPTPNSVPTSSSPPDNTALTAPQVETVTSTPVPAKSSLSVGAIAGIAIGGVAALAVVGILVFLIVTRRRKREIIHLPPSGSAQQPFGYGGTSPAIAPGQVPTQTIIIPMTEAEKMMYLEKIGRSDGVMSPVSPDGRMAPDQQYGTVTSNMTDISRSTTGRLPSGAPQLPPPVATAHENGDPARWQTYGTLQSPAEMGPGGTDTRTDSYYDTPASPHPANEPTGYVQQGTNEPTGYGQQRNNEPTGYGQHRT